ncbi:hypothetical protein [Burkholderia cenocepacia]|uniref:hypothetical protein n=1 Tax=Burkholderia cenocepacia TaxID=95486 RepID=UPI002B24213A|nr:hypothetical protein [Burkholderia cenocepacia]MEB2544323.1 hypothetical protein [Burkholderia cenocepacia]
MIPKGTKVKVRDDEIEHFLVAFQKKVAGRVGVVTGHPYGNGETTSLVTFPAVGRRKEYGPEQIRNQWLEIVEG